MSFLSEILGSSDETEIDSTDKNLRIITKKLTSYKEDISKYVDEVYKKLGRWPSRNEKLLRKTTLLCEDIDNIKTNIDNAIVVTINKQHVDIDFLKNELEEKKTISSLILSVTEIHEKLRSMQCYAQDRNYVQAAIEQKQIESFLSELPQDALKNVVNGLKKKVTEEKHKILSAINNDLYKLLIMKEGKNGVLQTNVLKISKSQELKETFDSLKMFDVLHEQLREFSSFFWMCICKPIISNITKVHVHEDEDSHILTVSIKKTQLHRSYKEVLERLLEVFRFIRSHLDLETNDDCAVVSYLGGELKIDFAEALLKKCLGSTLPSNDKKGVDYKRVLEDTKEFEAKLVEFGFLEKDKNPILEYVNDMKNLLANTYCEKYSERATTIMKKDLHDMVEVGVHFDPANPLTEDQFPQCYVSKSCIELLNLAKEILQQALEESDIFAIRSIDTMQSCFYQYGSIVYAHHAKLLQHIPQQVVLFRNNCMYLAHELAQLNKSYNQQFSTQVLTEPPIFKDQPHQLRTIGGNTFLEYTESHINSMERTLLECKFESNRLSEIMCVDANKCIRQCLRQYELLRTVWHKILPHPVYNKTLGHLLNVFCKRLIDTVVNAPDILVTNAETLIEMFKVILARGPKLFTDPDEVNLYVELWQKLNELVFILGANLDQITERWVHGPLSMQFTPEEVKHLIKALFQNTDRRAQALNRIVSF